MPQDGLTSALSEQNARMAEMAKAGSHHRWLICTLLFLATSINYLDRQVFGLLIPDLQRELHISEIEYGRLVMAFQLSYAVMMAYAGRILDRIGARLGMSIAVVLWSIAEIGHMVARTALGFGVARFVLGFAEAANFPACVKLISELFPARERATATGVINSATAVGAIAAPLVVPFVASRYGWQATFLVTGLIGFVWLAVWIPVQRREISQKGSNAMVAPSSQAPIAWSALIRIRQFWAFAAARIIVDPIWYFYVFWLPKFLAEGHGIRGAAATPYLSAIYVCAGVGCIASGYLSSTLIRTGWSVNRARKSVMWGLVALATPALLIAERVDSVTLTMVLIGIAVGAHQAISTHLYTLPADLLPSRITGVAVGLGSSLSALASVITAEGIGQFLQRNPGSYGLFFVIAACIYPVAMLLIQVLSPRLAPHVMIST